MTVIVGRSMRVTRLDGDGEPVGGERTLANVTFLGADGEPLAEGVVDPGDLLGKRVSVSFSVETTGWDGSVLRALTGLSGLSIGEPEETDLLFQAEDLGLSDTMRGSSAIRAVMWAAGGGRRGGGNAIEDARMRLQTEMNRRYAEAAAKPRVYQSVLKKFSGNVWNGVPRPVLDTVLADLGWVWVPVMAPPVGEDEARHVRWSELPEEGLADQVILRCSSDEYVPVAAGVVCHPADPSREGTRLYYGYYARREVREVFAQAGAES